MGVAGKPRECVLVFPDMRHKRRTPWRQRHSVKYSKGAVSQAIEEIGAQGRRSAKIMAEHVGTIDVPFAEECRQKPVLHRKRNILRAPHFGEPVAQYDRNNRPSNVSPKAARSVARLETKRASRESRPAPAPRLSCPRRRPVPRTGAFDRARSMEYIPFIASLKSPDCDQGLRHRTLRERFPPRDPNYDAFR